MKRVGWSSQVKARVTIDGLLGFCTIFEKFNSIKIPQGALLNEWSLTLNNSKIVYRTNLKIVLINPESQNLSESTPKLSKSNSKKNKHTKLQQQQQQQQRPITLISGLYPHHSPGNEPRVPLLLYFWNKDNTKTRSRQSNPIDTMSTSPPPPPPPPLVLFHTEPKTVEWKKTILERQLDLYTLPQTRRKGNETKKKKKENKTQGRLIFDN
ncbi:hypothetical protein BLOT_009884 [Blomia tropicalis]|nr:hypothetical protein BLOT_009884 [Blomia tropicalis]